MHGPLLTELPYHPDSAVLFDGIAGRPWSVLLDSGRPAGHWGDDQARYDILAAEPDVMLTTRGPMTEIRTRDSVSVSPDDPLALLRPYLLPVAPRVEDLPFCGGAIGYFGYDLARRLERLPERTEDAEQLPEMAIGIYDWALVVDHREQRTRLVGQGRDPHTRARWKALCEQFSRPQSGAPRTPFQVTAPARSNMNRDGYARAFARIQHYIREGDCYQVNLAQRFAARVEGDTWLAYRRLREANPAPFAAYLNLPFAQILSASPERFLRVIDGEVETRPIKGTRRRGFMPEEDYALTDALHISAKDRAENLMIVDLLRNDLGRTCEAGSIRVPELFKIESFATVHHLVSTVIGRLAPGRDALDLLRGCFPGGSITGAPKLRAMEIIEELEPHRRGVYCGSIGYLGFDGNMDSNIAIRTLIHSDGVIRFWAGGGIVADSTLEAEYQETYDKAAAMLQLLERMEMAHVGS